MPNAALSYGQAYRAPRVSSSVNSTPGTASFRRRVILGRYKELHSFVDYKIGLLIFEIIIKEIGANFSTVGERPLRAGKLRCYPRNRLFVFSNGGKHCGIQISPSTSKIALSEPLSRFNNLDQGIRNKFRRRQIPSHRTRS
jgi:hypothetical protein